MIGALVKRVFDTANDRYVKTLDAVVAKFGAQSREVALRFDPAMTLKV